MAKSDMQRLSVALRAGTSPPPWNHLKSLTAHSVVHDVTAPLPNLATIVSFGMRSWRGCSIGSTS